MKKLFLFLLILLLTTTAARADVVTITVTDLIASGKTGEVYTSRIIDEFWDGEGSSSFSSGMDSDEYKLSYAAVNGNLVEKSRTTFLNPESVISLTEYLKTRTDDSPYLFTHIRHPTGSDGRLEKKTIQMLLRQIASRVPSLDKKLTPHILRHTAATIALRNGMPMEQVKEFLGHSNINTTMIYAKLDKADIKRSHEKYLG